MRISLVVVGVLSFITARPFHAALPASLASYMQTGLSVPKDPVNVRVMVPAPAEPVPVVAMMMPPLLVLPISSAHVGVAPPPVVKLHVGVVPLTE